MRAIGSVVPLAFLALACAGEHAPEPGVSGESSPAVAEFDVAGFWEFAWLQGYDHTTLVLERLDGERWRARVYRATCTGNRWWEVSARREAGVIVLETTKAMVTDEPFRTLVPARIDGLDCLVPEVYQEKLDGRAHLPQAGTAEQGWAFVRGEPADPAAFHARWLASDWPAFDFGTAGEEEPTLEDLDAEEEEEEK